jgi:hypothetical protein
MHHVRSYRRTVLTVGKPTPLSDQSLIAEHLTVFALATNTDLLYLGDRGVQAAAGFETGYQMRRNDVQTFHCVDLKDIWIDAKVAGEGVSLGVVLNGL